MKKMLLVATAAFICGGLLATCAPKIGGTQDALGDLPGGDRIIGADQQDHSVVILRPDNSYRMCWFTGDSRGWLCDNIPPIPPPS